MTSEECLEIFGEFSRQRQLFKAEFVPHTNQMILHMKYGLEIITNKSLHGIWQTSIMLSDDYGHKAEHTVPEMYFKILTVEEVEKILSILIKAIEQENEE